MSGGAARTNVDKRKPIRAGVEVRPLSLAAKAPRRAGTSLAAGQRRLWPRRVLIMAGLVGLLVLVRFAFKKPEVAKPRPRAEAQEEPTESAPRTPPPIETITIEQPTTGAPPQTTEAVLVGRGEDCLSCVKENGCLDSSQSGGACEGASGRASACGPGITEKDICLKTLKDIFLSNCAAVGQETPCLCGLTNTQACFDGTERPTGPIYADYACDFNTTNVTAILANFKEPRFGAGQANSLVQCAAQSECKCFGN
jgi:hypothetical protein